MKDPNQVQLPASCTGCGGELKLDPRGFNTCSTESCGGNLLEQFPITGDSKEDNKSKTRRRRGRRKSARN